MVVVLYAKNGVTKIATAYIGRSLEEVKAEGWSNNPLVTGYYEVDDVHQEAVTEQVWKCALSAEAVVAQGTLLAAQGAYPVAPVVAAAP